MPGAVSAIARPRVARFCAAQPLGVAAVDLVGHPELAVGDLVVALGVDDAPERVVVAAQGLGELGHRALGVVDGGQQPAARGARSSASHWAWKPAPPSSDGGDRRVGLEVLGDEDLVGVALADRRRDRAHEVPALGQVAGAEAVDGAHVEGRVEAQPVEVELLEPHQGVVVQVGAHLLAAVVGTGVAPRGRRALVVVEVDAALAVLAPAVELPQREVARAEVVDDDVEDDRDAVPVGLLDEALERVGAAVAALDGEGVGRVVAPGVVTGELGRPA